MTKLLALTILVALTVPAAANPKPTPAVTATLKEIEKTVGFVPSFVRAVPQVLLPSWWEGVKAMAFNPNTALDGKTKDLIGLAVAATTPCEYCIYFHTESARLNGATDQEISEALGVASQTRGDSTLLNGMQVDKAQFKKDVDRIVKSFRAQMKK